MENQPKPLGRGLRVLAYLAFGMLIGLLGADSFARAIGLPDVRELGRDWEGAVALRIVLGIALAFVSMVFAAVAVHLVTAWTMRLAAAPQRPGLAMSIVMMSCGSVCILLSLIFYWWLAAASTIITPQGGEAAAIALERPTGRSGQMTITAGGAVEVRKQTSPLTHLVAVGTFAVGVVLLALGIWGSMAGRARPVSAPAAPAYGDAGPE